MPRIKLDLIADERLVLAPVRASIFHPYSDAPAREMTVRTYAYEELFAEKTRALAERTRPRDLYDVINLFRNEEARPSPDVMREVLAQKCEHKGIPFPQLVALEPHRATLAGSWKSVLEHQLPSLPPLEAFWRALPAFFEWLASGRAPMAPLAYPVDAGETLLRERVLRLPISAKRQSHIEVTRFAGANRLLVELGYRDLDGVRSTRTVEPYSLVQTAAGDIFLHTHDRTRAADCKLRVDRIERVGVTNQSFEPRFQLALGPQSRERVSPAAYKTPMPALQAAIDLGARARERTKPGARQPARDTRFNAPSA